jgi:hypothetical protein
LTDSRIHPVAPPLGDAATDYDWWNDDLLF